MKRIPHIDLKELDKIKEEILKERVESHNEYIKWLQKKQSEKEKNNV